MSKILSRSRALATVFASLFLAWAVAACASSSPNATSTATPFVLQPTPTPEQVTNVLPIPATTQLSPSPDGTLLVAVYSSTSSLTIRLYTLTGTEVGSPYALPLGGGKTWSWLPDSSGLFISRSGAQLLILDRQGRVQSTGLTISSPQLSQDMQWIGGTALSSDGSITGAEIAPRHGGTARLLAPSGVFLGWQNNRAIYTTGGYGSKLYAQSPGGGAPVFLTQLTGAETPELPQGEVSSPDGQVLGLQLGKAQSMILVGNQLRPGPAAPDWIGQHDIMVSTLSPNNTQAEFALQDLVTGQVVHDTAVSAYMTSILAISGAWMITTNNETGQLLQLTLVNYMTNSSIDINPSLGSIVPVGNQGKFLGVETTNSGGRQPVSTVVTIDPGLTNH
jgi:hypothetical protein